MNGPRRFHLTRDHDNTTVADGILWPDRTATIRWRSNPSTIDTQPLADIKAIRGHHIVLTSAADRLGRIAHAHTKEITEGGMTSGCCTECGNPWPCPTYVWATEERDPLATWDPADDEEPNEMPDTPAAVHPV
ncbi:hypothetical protein ACFYY8_33680 [Streptosporangium sp. NPDC001559]|uniref:hypothetical protein n=1 Tax=Streptosporangium sp. NPDC001559 TaxID=3366187 RepID=UPI0036E27F04